MLGLFIENIKIVVNTNGGRFSTNIPFYRGLNIIRADNSSGKSTCVNAIAYAIGLEAILGPSRKRPFPKSLYETIYDAKENGRSYSVINSFVVITIKNNAGTEAILTRDIRGDSNKVTVETEVGSDDYFLGSAGKIGSANSDKGFHFWLVKFIGWTLPNVVTYDAKETKLYLECIFPLFFIEQKRGWSEIQANIPTYYGIKNVKKIAVEFCLAIDSFEHEKKIAVLKSKIDLARIEWDKLCSSAEGIADFNVVNIRNLGDLNEKELFNPIIFSYLENNVYITVNEQERSLNKFIENISNDIRKKTPENDLLNTQFSIVRTLQRKIEEVLSSVELILLSQSEVENKLVILNHDYKQYLQLKRLKTVGSDISADITTKKCPICESDLYDTLGNSTVKREPMTLEENIEFLKNQIDFFNSIKDKKTSLLDKCQINRKLLSEKIKLENQKLNDLREDMVNVNGAANAILRDKIQAEISLRNVLNLKKVQVDLNEQADKIYSHWLDAKATLKIVRGDSSATNSEFVRKQLEELIKINLKSFKFNHSSLNSILISKQTLRPEQDGYDIVAESSASDYIRIIWGYTLALLELAGNEQKINHGGFVVLDEPRQHEASIISFGNLMGKASDSKKYGGQVIFATSLDESELKKACVDKNINLVCFNNYILTLEKNSTSELKDI